MSTETTKQDGRYTCQEAVRMPFSNLIVPKPVGKKGKAKGEPKYSGTFLFKPDGADLAGLKAKAAAVAKARWPGRNLSELKFPFTAGQKRADKAKAGGKDGAFFVGHVVLDARSKYQPQLAVRNSDGTIRELAGNQIAVEGKAKFYGGCMVAASITFAAYEGQEEDGVGNPDGVNAYLDAVVWLGDGERIGGGNPVETFRHFAGTVTNENPTAGGDEIPF